MSLPILPNFLIGGATSAGTSFLFDLLIQHPDIYLPSDMCSEPHFFAISERYNKGIDWYQKIWFSEYKNQRAIGERSSAYLYFPETAPRLKIHLPLIKLIFILRDPVDRAFAQYRYRVFRGTESLDFTAAIQNEPHRLEEEIKHGIEKASHDYRGRSLYGKQLQRFLNYFPHHQILLLSSEKLRNNTTDELKKVTDFLQIDPLKILRNPSDFSTPRVKNPLIQFKAREHFGNKRNPETVKTAKWESLLHAIRQKKQNLSMYIETSEDAEHLKRMQNNLSEEKEAMPEETRVFLELYFREDQKIFKQLKKLLKSES